MSASWLPIESAPKDGTRLWLFWPDASPDSQQCVGWWQDGWPNRDSRWTDYADHHEFDQPTHWMLLSEPPQPAAQDGGEDAGEELFWPESPRQNVGRVCAEDVFLALEQELGVTGPRNVLSAALALAKQAVRDVRPSTTAPDLEALDRTATQGNWRLCEMENHGTSPSDTWTDYGIEVGEGHAKVVLDTINSGTAVLHSETDEDGHFLWNEQGKCDLTFVCALVNAYRSGTLRSATPAHPEPPDSFGAHVLTGRLGWIGDREIGPGHVVLSQQRYAWLMERAAPPARRDRDAVARIVDPHSFLDLPLPDDPHLHDMVVQAKADAYRKADQILALASDPTPQTEAHPDAAGSGEGAGR